MTLPLLVVLRPLGLGDFLTGVPAYRAIARHFPHHYRVLAAPRALHALVPATRAFDDAIDVAPLTPLPSELHDADVAVDLHGRGPASHHILLAARPRRLIAFANDAIAQSAGGARWEADEHEVWRWCRMLRAYDIAARPDDLLLDPPRRASPGNLTLIHPGAASGSRRWPLERWAIVARELVRRGHDVALTGTPEEFALTSAIAAKASLPPGRNLAGTTDLVGLSALVGGARLLLSSDTGVAHLAFAHRTPSITLFGPTSPAHWGPPGKQRHRVLWHGRTGDPHGREVDHGLLAIDVDEVLEAVREPARRSA
ncbi:MAG: glycosyltransferase family 9 protein [Vulcanimicrobiaceae bacterium]